MKNVDVQQLFEALTAASRKQERVATGNGWEVHSTMYGFRCLGPISPDTIWYFYVDKPSPANQEPQNTCRFYSLSQYLEAGFTVDDITTAVTTEQRCWARKAD